MTKKFLENFEIENDNSLSLIFVEDIADGELKVILDKKHTVYEITLLGIESLQVKNGELIIKPKSGNLTAKYDNFWEYEDE